MRIRRRITRLSLLGFNRRFALWGFRWCSCCCLLSTFPGCLQELAGRHHSRLEDPNRRFLWPSITKLCRYIRNVGMHNFYNPLYYAIYISWRNSDGLVVRLACWATWNKNDGIFDPPCPRPGMSFPRPGMCVPRPSMSVPRSVHGLSTVSLVFHVFFWNAIQFSPDKIIVRHVRTN